MALDFNQISARLTRLPDDALSAFARQHMSNYSIMSLVANELSRRKGIRDAAALKMAGTPPPVNEQLVASLSSGQAPTQGGAGGMDPATLPENQGLGLLPIKTAYVAECGIVGYADGGVARFNGDERSDVPSIESAAGQGELIERARRRRLEAERQAGDWAPTEAEVRERTLKSMLPFPLNVAAEAIGFTGGAAPVESSGPPVSQRTLDARDALAGRAAPVAAPVSAPTRAAPRPMTGIAQLAPQRQPAVDPRQQAMETAKYFMGDLEPRYNQQTVDELKQRQDAIRQRQEASHKAYLASIPTDKAGAAAEARYKKEAEADPARRKEAFYMAMVEAGLGAMAATSPHFFTNIAEGALRGLGSYKSSMKELDALARSRNEALDAIDKARRAEQMGLAKDKLSLEKDALRLEDEFSEKMFNFIENRKGLDEQAKRDMRKSAMEIYVNEKKQREQLQAQREIAGMQLAARTDQMDTLNAQYAAAVRAGDTKRAEETLSIIRNLRGAPRGALTDAQENAIVAKFFDRRPIAETVYSADPTYRQAVLAAAARGETPPMPTQEQIRASRAPRVQPGSITPVGQ